MSPTLPGSANSIPEVVDATSISPTMSFDLLRLPNELKDKIPEFLVGDTVTLDALSRTCRYLRYKCPTERFLYHSVVFDERSISGRARARQLLSSIVARPKLATYIRSYAVKDSDPLQKRAHPDTYYKDSSWKATNAIYGEIASLIPEIRAKLLELYGNPGATNSGAQQQRVWIDQALGICRLAGFAGVSALVVHLSPYIERIEVANSRHMDLINNTFCYIDLIERLFKEDNNKSALHKLLGITIRPSEYIYLNPPVRLPMLPAIHGDGVVTVPCLPTIEALTIHGHVRHVRHLQLHPEPSSAPHNLRHLSLYDIRVETSNLEAIIRTGALGKLALIVMHDVELEWHDFERLVDAMALHLPMLEELQCTYFNEWPSPTRGNPMSFEKLEQVRILRIDSRVLLDLQFYYTWPTEFEEEDWVNLNKIKQHLTTTRLPPHADVVHIGSMPLKMLVRTSTIQNASRL